MFCGPWCWNGPGTSSGNVNFLHCHVEQCWQQLCPSQLLAPKFPESYVSYPGDQLCRSFFLFSSLAQAQAQDKDVPTPYVGGLCHRRVCSTCWMLRLGLEISWVETRRREKNHEKGTVVVEKAGRVSPNMGCFLGSFMEQDVLFWEKKPSNYYTTYCLLDW